MTTKKVWKISKRERETSKDYEQTDICIVYDEEEAKNFIAYLVNIQDTNPFEWTSRYTCDNGACILVDLKNSDHEVIIEADLIEIVE